ncbi:hypothetical protein D8B26_001960 [Coccidioides posadasii str. Silveira]|uniref:uncharacterized protein n=1 Tax=Coccidioides posadasii (strain RMSCC 757 / Silveira) TaxID=443226 RepID=UPI001BEFA331|nr:hypothetical protein D8B26_001960 [Coccidioides posadasii str. Silveira]
MNHENANQSLSESSLPRKKMNCWEERYLRKYIMVDRIYPIPYIYSSALGAAPSPPYPGPAVQHDQIETFSDCIPSSFLQTRPTTSRNMQIRPAERKKMRTH